MAPLSPLADVPPGGEHGPPALSTSSGGPSHALDTTSSRSRQHHIDTGRYLTRQEVAELEAREARPGSAT